MPNSNKYKHIIWDWNGTLLNDSWMAVEVINETLSRRGMPTIDLDHYQKIFGFPVIDYYRRLGFDFVEESFEKVGTEFIEGYEKRKFDVDLHPCAKEVLDDLRDRGVTHSILSAYKQNTLDELVDHFDLTPFFLRVIGLDNHYAHSKVDNGKRWMKELHYNSSEILFIGDTVHDYEVAQAIAVDCILITGGHQTRATLEATGVMVVGSLCELRDLIFNI